MEVLTKTNYVLMGRRPTPRVLITPQAQTSNITYILLNIKNCGYVLLLRLKNVSSPQTEYEYEYEWKFDMRNIGLIILDTHTRYWMFGMILNDIEWYYFICDGILAVIGSYSQCSVCFV